MNAATQHLLLHEVSRGLAQFAGHHDQLCAARDNLALRDKDTVAGRAIPDARHSIPGILSNNGIDVENRHAKRRENIAVSHDQNTPSLCNDDDHLTPRGTVINKFVADRNIRFRVASCVVSEHSTRSTTAHRVVAARLSSVRFPTLLPSDQAEPAA